MKTMKKTVILSAILTPLFVATAFAQTTIKAEVDRTAITTEEAITYKLIITSLEKDMPSPQLPKFTGFKVISSAQSSTVTFAKGNAKTIVVYAFILVPVDTGKFKIEPSSITIKNETFSTGELEIEVKEGKTKPKTEPEQKPPIPKETRPEESPQITL